MNSFGAILSVLTVMTVAVSAQAENLLPVRAAAQPSAPKYIFDNPDKSGICLEIYAELKKQVRADGILLVMPNSPYPTKRAMTLVENGTYDIFCGADKSKRRLGRYVFSSKPLYSISNIVAKRKSDDAHPEAYAHLADGESVVGGLYGNSSSLILEDHMKPHAKARINTKYKTLIQGLEALQQGKIRYFFYHDLGLHYQIQTRFKDLVPVDTKFRTYEHYMLFTKGLDEKAVSAIDRALNRMHDAGTIRDIVARYRVDAPQIN